MPVLEKRVEFRVRYSEIDKMGTFYNSRALEWFEWGRVELLREAGIPYAQCEARGHYLPLIEAHVEYLGRAGFDDRLTLITTMSMVGKARVRFDLSIILPPECCQGSCVAVNVTDCRKVVKGHTIHAVTDCDGRPIRPEPWFADAVKKAQGAE